METPNLDVLKSFTLENMPDLDAAVLGALELFQTVKLPSLKQIPFQRPLVIGSVGAHTTGRIVFEKHPAVFADENSYKAKLQMPDLDGAVIISASGGKHSIEIAQALKAEGIPTYLITNNADAPARSHILDDHVLVYPKNREPYTYNTSTYLGMILSATGERAADLYQFIIGELSVALPANLAEYRAYTLVLPPHLALIRDMLRTKFDELFGPQVLGRVFTSEEIKHAKTVVHSDTELFITIGVELAPELCHGSAVLPLGLPQHANYGALMTAGYYIIGTIQQQHPPYFKQSIKKYTDTASLVFGQKIEPIVE